MSHLFIWSSYRMKVHSSLTDSDARYEKLPFMSRTLVVSEKNPFILLHLCFFRCVSCGWFALCFYSNSFFFLVLCYSYAVWVDLLSVTSSTSFLKERENPWRNCQWWRDKWKREANIASLLSLYHHLLVFCWYFLFSSTACLVSGFLSQVMF